MYNHSYGVSSSLNFADVAEAWGPNEVADWLRGLSDSVLPYIPVFLSKKINGAELLTLDEGDLERIGVTDTGAQQAIMMALYQLVDLCYFLDKKNLQSLAMKLGVQARNLHNELKFRLDQLSRDANAAFGWLPNDVLSYVSTLVDDTKEIISWLDRSPFDVLQDYVTIRNTILSFASTIVQCARQPSTDLTQTAREVQMACTQLCSIADKVVQEFNDPLILQTAYLEKSVVKRSDPVDDFGINIESTVDGVHIVNEVKFQSPADFSGKIEVGDEIIQACGRTVVGWPLSKLATILNESRFLEAPFLLKKRPRHYYGHQTLGGKAPASAAPKFQQTRTAVVLPTLNSVRSAAQLQQMQRGKTRRRSSSVSVPRTPVEKAMAAEVRFTPPRSPASPLPTIILPPNEVGDDFEADMHVPQRRATVSGGSPTLKRLSLHLNRNISVNPRPQSHWFQDNTVSKNLERVGDVCDLDIAKIRSKLAPNSRSVLVSNQPRHSPKDQPLVKKQKISPKFVGLAGRVIHQQSLDDDVFDYPILDELAETAKRAMPSDSSDDVAMDDKDSDSSASESLLEVAEPDEVPPEAMINDDEWNMPIQEEMEESEEMESQTFRSITSGTVHKTRSFPGRDVTAPKQAQDPLATLPRNSKTKLMKFFGETMWYDMSSDAEDSQSVGSSRKSLTSSHMSVASGGNWSSKISPRSVGQLIHLPKKHKETTLPLESGSGSPILTGMRRLASRRQQAQRLSSSTDPSGIDVSRKNSEPVSKPSLVEKQILAILNSGNLSESLRLKLHCHLPCKSVGMADFQGWVHRARCSFEHLTTKKWNKRWLVLKKECLIIYKSTEDTKAEGVLWLPAYRVCPAGPEYKTTKRNVFKLYSANCCFYFYCYHRQDMLQWLNKLGLAAIGYSELDEKNANLGDTSTVTEFYFAILDDNPPNEFMQHRVQDSQASSSLPKNFLQTDSFINTLRHSWRRSRLSRENSNDSSLSCHSEGAVSASSTPGSSKAIRVRDPLHVRGAKTLTEMKNKSAGKLDDEV